MLQGVKYVFGIVGIPVIELSMVMQVSASKKFDLKKKVLEVGSFAINIPM